MTIVLKLTVPGNPTVTTGASVTPTTTHQDVRTVTKAGWAPLVTTPVFTEPRMPRTRCVSVTRHVGTVQGVISSVPGMVCVTAMVAVTVHISLVTRVPTVKYQVCTDKLSLLVRKTVFRISYQVRHEPCCTATEDG